MQIFIEEVEINYDGEVEQAFLDDLLARHFIMPVESATPRFALTNDPNSFIRLFEAFADASIIDSLRSSSGSLRSPTASLRSSNDSLRSSGLTQLASQIASIFLQPQSGKLISSALLFGEINISNPINQNRNTTERSEVDEPLRRLSDSKEFAELSGMIVQKKEAVKHKMKRSKEASIVKITHDQSDLLLAKDWVIFAHAKTPWIEYDSIKFAEAINKIKRHSKMNDEQMRRTFLWIRDNPFWSNVAHSPVGLMRTSKSNELRKIDNIMHQMRQQYIGTNQVLRGEERSQYDTDTTELDFYRSLLEKERTNT